MSTLYELTEDYLHLLELLEEEEYLDPKVFTDTLEGIEGAFETKAEGYARVIQELLAEAEKYEKEQQRMEAIAKSRRNRAEMLKKYLYKSMKATGKLKFKTEFFQFGIQKNGGVRPVMLVPDVEIPEAYYKKEPDTAKIRETLQKGETLPFAVLKERGEHLVIR